jgi:nickel-dependent lactate racemase
MPADGLLDIDLAYGRQGLRISLPADRTTVVAPAYHPAVPDVPAALRDALGQPVAGPPLRAVVRPGQRVAVSVCDVTRPQPREAMLRALLAELEGLVTADDLTVLIATGTHRGNTAAELGEMLGPELAARLRVVNHDARDESMLTWCGEHGDGVPVWLNKHWTEAVR